MEDEAILRLYVQRQDAAIAETDAKYGRLCFRVADHILSNGQDAEECVNDTWLHAWNAIPPVWPKKLSVWLTRVTRNLAISTLRRRHAQKRGADLNALVLDELAECIPGESDPQRELERRELAAHLNRFLATLRQEERDIFVARYYFSTPVAELAARTGWTTGKINSMLQRLRRRLQAYLEEEQIC